MGRACCEKTKGKHFKKEIGYRCITHQNMIRIYKKKTQVFSYLNKVIINIENKLYDCLSLLAGDSFQASDQEMEIKPGVGALN